MHDPVSRLTAALAQRYAIERELGQGGMATVYLANDLRHERQVALKVLKPELAAIVGSDRFLVEIKTTANLHHPHILPLFDSGEADGFLYYVMPYVEGESLQDRLDREKQLPVDEAVAIVTKVAGALQAAHDKGIVHRDIKPANILLANGEPLVADFGIALAVQQAGGGRLTETGLSLGTPYYMSPEQATADRDPDARADVYSLACVLYEMLSGEPPFTGTSAQAVLGRILTQAPPSVRAERASVPAHVDAAIVRALQKLPADRFEAAAAFAAALNDPAGATGSFAMPPVSGSRPALRRPAVVVPWTVALVASIAAVAAWLGGPPQPAPRTIRFALGAETANLGRRPGLAITDDGLQVVLLGSADGETRLYRRSLDNVGVAAIQGTEGAESIALSSSGRWVAFSTREGVVKRVSLEGGAPVVMANTPNLPIGIAWNGDDELVMGMMEYSDEYPGLSTVQRGENTVHKLTLPRADQADGDFGMHHEPFSLGDGHVLYLDFGEEHGVSLGVASLDDGVTHRVDLSGTQIRGWSSIVGVADEVLVFVDNGNQLMAVAWDPRKRQAVGEPVAVPGVPAQVAQAAMAPNGTLVMALMAQAYQLMVVDDRGNVVQPVGDPGNARVVPRFSPDGRRAALADGSSGEVWTYDFTTGLLAQLSMGFYPYFADWSPDGRRVLSGRWDRRDGQRMGWLASRAADASDEATRFLELPDHEIEAATWSPDGVTLALVEDKGPYPSLNNFDIFTFRTDGDGAPTPFAAGPANEVSPRFSPDGKWLAYASNETGRYQVYARPFPGPGPRIQISDQGGGQPLWSGDGRQIFYRSGRSVMRASLSSTASGTLAVSGRDQLFLGDYNGGADDPAATWDATPDGRRFLVARAEGDANARTLVWADWLDDFKATASLAGR